MQFESFRSEETDNQPVSSLLTTCITSFDTTYCHIRLMQVNVKALEER